MTNKYDVIILGSGPAGNTSAIYLARDNLKVALFTGGEIGGQLITTTEVENYPGFVNGILGADLMSNIMQQTQRLGAEIFYEKIVSINFNERPFKCKTENNEIYEANYIVIATGAEAKYLNIASETKFKGRGVSACAVCDGNFHKGKDVAVVGGGNSAGTETLHLSHLCSKVYLIHRRNEFRMGDKMLEKIKNTKNIEIVGENVVEEIIGDTKVSGIKIKNIKNNETKQIDLSGVFISIGREPGTKIFKNTYLQLDENDYIVTQPDGAKTNINGVYAVGDVVNKKFKQGVIAAGYGAIAAMEIEKDMQK
ncbi:MAG: thioredoxin-disulfide reductase [Rickettsiales bacterium]|nr:thioredoxin-disulfide reductase [Rickettsiales bacterium]